MICVAHEIFFLFLDQLTSWVIDWVRLSCAQLDWVCIFLNLGFHSYVIYLFLNHGSQYTALVVPYILGILLEAIVHCAWNALYSWQLIELYQT